MTELSGLTAAHIAPDLESLRVPAGASAHLTGNSTRASRHLTSALTPHSASRSETRCASLGVSAGRSFVLARTSHLSQSKEAQSTSIATWSHRCQQENPLLANIQTMSLISTTRSPPKVNAYAYANTNCTRTLYLGCDYKDLRFY